MRITVIAGNGIGGTEKAAFIYAAELAKRGHQVTVGLEPGSFGRGQMIRRNPDTGVLEGGTESRTDGHIAAY